MQSSETERSMYKDLVLLLQKDNYLSVSQLKTTGELSFEQDSLVEGCREVRQFRSDLHPVRFYFPTRLYSSYMKNILADFRTGLKPDFLICRLLYLGRLQVWSKMGFPQYRENHRKLFEQIKAGMLPECLAVWNLVMPLGKKITLVAFRFLR
ncbi:PC-esterase domain-containing protein 1A-like [Salvelinus alpinus]